MYSRIINHHGQPIKVGSNGAFEPVKGILNRAFTSEAVTPRVGEVLKRKKIDKLDLISRNETVSKDTRANINIVMFRLRSRQGSPCTKELARRIQNSNY